MAEMKFIEQGLYSAGEGHAYQQRILLLTCLQSMVSAFFNIGPSYFFPDPQFICDNDKACEENNGGCDKMNLKQSEYETITSDFKLYCDLQFERSLSQSALFFGPIFGNIFFSQIADWKGRWISLNISWVFSCIGLFGIVVSTTHYQLIGFILLTGFCLDPSANINMTILSEQSGNKFRERGTIILLTSWGVFGMIFVPIAMYVPNWRDVFIYFLLIPSLLIGLGLFYLIYESPRFYLVKGRISKIYQVLNCIAKVNERDQLTEATHPISEVQLKQYQEQKQTHSVIDLIRYRSLCLTTIASCLIMFFICLIYYVPQYSISAIGSDMYLIGFVLASGESLALFTGNFFITHIRRKLCTFIVITGSIIPSSLLFFDFGEIETIIIVGLQRILNSFGMAILTVFIQELYPTPVRSMGVGATMSFGVAGSALAPFIISWSRIYNLNPIFVSGIISIPALFLIILFHETKGQSLKDSLKEYKGIQITPPKQKEQF